MSDAEAWEFWIDRGGTFTDIIAKTPAGKLIFHKLLSANPTHYEDAAIQGIRDCLKIKADEAIPTEKIKAIKMGTTVATNALLERRGEPTLLLTTEGFKDILAIGYQNRPNIFALHVQSPSMLYHAAVEIKERISAQGEVLQPLDETQVNKLLAHYHQQGLRSVAIVFMHGYHYPQHEQRVAQLAKNIGYQQISVSHQVSPLPKIVPRGDTTVVDAYLTPILKRYIAGVRLYIAHTDLHFMQSNGGLAQANYFSGKDSILSGPAGGVVGMVKTASQAGYQHLIGFDMGGTSTDVCHYKDHFERSHETQIAGIRLTTPMIKVHTVAAGGGSILHFKQQRFQVGPDSAGAYPGPACYGHDGPLTITDCHVLLGRIPIDYFPKVFGKHGNAELDKEIVLRKFNTLTETINQTTKKQQTPFEIALGYLQVAVTHMANAIKKISVEKGIDIRHYTLCCFGSASGQLACAVANELGIKQILIHPLAGGLSALGIGLADHRFISKKSLDVDLTQLKQKQLQQAYQQLITHNEKQLQQQGFADNQLQHHKTLFCRYQGSDTSLELTNDNLQNIAKNFTQAHQLNFGFTQETPIVLSNISVETIAISQQQSYTFTTDTQIDKTIPKNTTDKVYLEGKQKLVPIIHRTHLQTGEQLHGPALIIDNTNTILLEPDWQLEVTTEHHLQLTMKQQPSKHTERSTQCDPMLLEIFNNQFMSIAEQMGVVLRQTAYSVNIKERLDFSCALFDAEGNLIANAPHIPVHLGSMSESVKAIRQGHQQTLKPGDVFMLNSPYHGGTHLPDITVITPIFDQNNKQIIFYVASRGHHADIGGITPGSMPAYSEHIEEEGILIEDFQIVRQGKLLEQDIRQLLQSSPYPSRNIHRNLADLKAQIAANEKGRQSLMQLIKRYGLKVVTAYMQHIKQNAKHSVIQLLPQLNNGEFNYPMDNGATINVKIKVSPSNLLLDFSKSQAPPGITNFNAPIAVVKAAVLYVLRCLVQDNIPLNAGCYEPVELILPQHSLLQPTYPDPVVAGNVETSQCLVDTLLAALGIMAGAQGTINNLTLGNQQFQYYETICGGVGAGHQWHGADAVHTHITNTRITDPEILESRFPLRLIEFSIRQGSGGSGKFHGGNGVIRKIQCLEAMSANILSNRRRVPPTGLAGGNPGQCGKNEVIRTQGKTETLPACAEIKLHPGDTLIITTPGGGGYFTED